MSVLDILIHSGMQSDLTRPKLVRNYFLFQCRQYLAPVRSVECKWGGVTDGGWVLRGTQKDAGRVCWCGWQGVWGRGWFVCLEGIAPDDERQGCDWGQKNLCKLPRVRWPDEKWEAAPRVDSIEAAHICRWSVSALPSCEKSCWSRWWCMGRSSLGVVRIRSWMRWFNSACWWVVSQLIMWWTSEFLKSHCLCVTLSRDLRKETPYLIIDFQGGQLWRKGRTVSMRKIGICPSTKKSQPSQSWILASTIYLLPGGVQLSIETKP